MSGASYLPPFRNDGLPPRWFELFPELPPRCCAISCLGLFPELPPRWFELGAPISWARVINHPARPATGAGARGVP